MFTKRQPGGKWRVMLLGRDTTDLRAWEYLALKRLFDCRNDDDIEFLRCNSTDAADHLLACTSWQPDLMLVQFNLLSASVPLPVKNGDRTKEAVHHGWLHAGFDDRYELKQVCYTQAGALHLVPPAPPPKPEPVGAGVRGSADEDRSPEVRRPGSRFDDSDL